jgi:signal transduction histidine kinase/CheY-like chemotaxis protein
MGSARNTSKNTTVNKKLNYYKALNKELHKSNLILQKQNNLLFESFEFSAAIMATIHEPMLVLNKDFEVKSANKAFYKKFKVTKEDIVGHNLFLSGSGQWNIAELRKLLNAVLTEDLDFQNFTFAQNFPGIGEKILLLNAHYIDQKISSEKLILLAIEDITERSTYYMKEKAFLRREKEMAEEAMRSKQQFLSNMSHEIRTPMNAIVGFTNILQRTRLNKKQKEFLSAIQTSCDTLTVLVNDILDLAKVDSGKMKFLEAPFKLSSSILSILKLFETKASEKGIELKSYFDSKIPDVILGDSVRLNQIILNLVANAIKFTDKGTVSIDVQLLKDEAKQVTLGFAITDTGIGIPEKSLPTIFNAFEQATDQTSIKYGGTGLGLAIVKQLIEAQNGTITVKSIPGRGSNFSFILNFKKTKVPADVQELPDKGHTNGFKKSKIKRRVLVVDDIKLNQFLMKTLLEDMGFESDIVQSGENAISKLKTKSYDIILMDLQMPGMDGFETTIYIRKKLNIKIPIIALTAEVTSSDAKKCKMAGMNDHMLKPIDEKLLYNILIKYTDSNIQKIAPQNNTSGYKAKYTDLSQLSRLTRGNQKMMKEIIDVFLEETPELTDRMRNAIDQKNWEALRAVTHSIMPSLKMMGLNKELKNALKNIQDHAISLRDSKDQKKDTISLINKLFLSIEKKYQQVYKELQN